MAKIDMIRSHLERLASSVWQGAKLDSGGRILIRRGTAVIEIYAADETTIAFRCTLAVDVPATPALYEWLNEQNRRSRLVKIVRLERDVATFVFMLADEIDANRLQTAVTVLGQFSDENDDRLVATYGGRLANPPPAPTPSTGSPA
jgi:hypothetical protein